MGNGWQGQVILEEIRHNVRLIAEGHTMLRERLDRFEQRWQHDVSDLQQRDDLMTRTLLSKIDSLGNGLNGRIDGLSERVEQGFSALSRQLQGYIDAHR